MIRSEVFKYHSAHSEEDGLEMGRIRREESGSQASSVGLGRDVGGLGRGEGKGPEEKWTR